jgi:hypothetical protein
MYLYIDSKIEGTIKMVLSYYDNGIFTPDTTILFKLYKSNTRLLKQLRNNNINVIVIKKWKDLPSLKNKTIYYMFNAQSNCRMVSYREAKHIFIGHGESNKLSSAKPIFRIYDYLHIAGKANIDRFLQNNIFNQCDIDNGKLVLVGNRYIKKILYKYNPDSKHVLYSPTWEGGIKEENYSSLNKELKSFETLHLYCKEQNITDIIIQPHPNTGHRDKRYILYLYNGIKYLKNKGYHIHLRNWSWFKYILKTNLINIQDSIDIKFAFCDISAMETQLLNNDIPYKIFINKTKNLIPNNDFTSKYYKQVGIYDFEYTNEKNINTTLYIESKNYYIHKDS